MNHPDPTAETLPNPYAFTMRVVPTWSQPEPAWLAWVMDVRGGGYVAARFDTKEEADTHAALILAALHQAVMG